jgi:hypothetical protein
VQIFSAPDERAAPVTSVDVVNLDVYRSCSFKEKREVLSVFWRTTAEGTERISRAAVQYGYVAIICLIAILLESVLLTVLSIVHGSALAWIGAAGDAFMVWAIGRALVRYRALKSLSGAQDGAIASAIRATD